MSGSRSNELRPTIVTEVFVSVGSNVDPERNIRRALAELHRRFGGINASTVYQSPAQGFVGDDFLNLAVGFSTEEDIHDIIAQLREVEDLCGRDRDGARFGPRPMDLDLLLFGDLVLESPELRLPRAETLEYAFVLGPLAEIAGDRRHPVTGRSFSEHWESFPAALKNLEPVEVSG